MDKDFLDEEFMYFIIKELYFIDENNNIIEIVGKIFYLDMKMKVLCFIQF